MRCQVKSVRAHISSSLQKTSLGSLQAKVSEDAERENRRMAETGYLGKSLEEICQMAPPSGKRVVAALRNYTLGMQSEAEILRQLQKEKASSEGKQEQQEGGDNHDQKLDGPAFDEAKQRLFPSAMTPLTDIEGALDETRVSQIMEKNVSSEQDIFRLAAGFMDGIKEVRNAPPAVLVHGALGRSDSGCHAQKFVPPCSNKAESLNFM